MGLFDLTVDFLYAGVFSTFEGDFADGYALGGGFVAFTAQGEIIWESAFNTVLYTLLSNNNS